MSLLWKEALKQFNDERIKNGEGRYMIPKKGTPEYAKVRLLMGDVSDTARELKSNEPIVPRDASKSRSPKVPKATQTPPQWVDEPKPVGKVNKSTKPKEPEPVVQEPENVEKKSKKSKKSKNVEPPADGSPKSQDFVVKIK